MTLPSPPLALGTSLPLYVGKPGNMQRLRLPDINYQANYNRAENVMQLASGGVAVTRRPKTKGSWVFNLSGLTADTANIFNAFYRGAMGLGPYVLLDPANRNMYTDDTSSMGSQFGAVSGWSTSVSSSSLTYDTSGLVEPFVESGTLNWTGAGNGSAISAMGAWSGATLVPDVNVAPIYLLDQVALGRLYARTASGTASVTLNTLGVTANGTITLLGTSVTATLNSSGWTQLAAPLAAGSATSLYILPILQCNTASAPVIQVSCADLQYGVTAATAKPWVLGSGSPRVVIPPSNGSGLPTIVRLLPVFRDYTMTFSEV